LIDSTATPVCLGLSREEKKEALVSQHFAQHSVLHFAPHLAHAVGAMPARDRDGQRGGDAGHGEERASDR
jgi:hypothetical protein